MGCTVGLVGSRGAVEADRDPVECLTGDDGVADSRLEVRELGPHVELVVAQRGVEVGLLADIVGPIHRGGIDARTARAACRVGAPGNRPADAQAELLTALFIDRNDIDLAQEFDGFLHARHERLLDRGATVNLRVAAMSGETPLISAIRPTKLVKRSRVCGFMGNPWENGGKG
jgi:hypothetical protein